MRPRTRIRPPLTVRSKFSVGQRDRGTSVSDLPPVGGTPGLPNEEVLAHRSQRRVLLVRKWAGGQHHLGLRHRLTGGHCPLGSRYVGLPYRAIYFARASRGFKAIGKQIALEGDASRPD